MARRIQLNTQRDFTGGLNLRADAYQLQANESPDLMNVDVDPRGGVAQRKGVLLLAPPPGGFNDPNKAPVKSMWEYTNAAGTRQIMHHAGTKVSFSTGANFGPAFNRSGLCRAATFKDICFVVDGDTNSVKWDGIAAQALALNWNDNLEAPKNDSMPIARTIASHMGSVWVGNTLEGGKRHPNRVRWSHPNFPTDWRSYDFIDIDIGTDGDEITALVPFLDRLLVFKKRAVYAVYGDSPETFQVFPITRELGTISQESVVATDVGVYFWSWPEGVFLYQGKEPMWQFERMYPALRDGSVSAAYQDQIHLGWGNRRLWVSVPWNGSATRNRCLVLDPTLGKHGAWTIYDLKLGPFLEFNPPGADATLLAADVQRFSVVRLDQLSHFDDFGDGPTPILARYRTRFVDLGEHAIPKMWKRPEIILQAGTNAEIFVNAYKDYDPTKVYRSFTLNSSPAPGDGSATVPDGDSGTVDAGTGWDTSLWDVALWGAGGRGSSGGGGGDGGGGSGEANRNERHRGVPLGNSRAVSLEFYGPDTLETWGINSITLKYIPKKPRS
jgi:hypothetical protein